MIVDDEQDFLDSLRRGLVTAGFKNLKLYKDPREAAAAMEQNRDVDIALIDISMPGMDGVSLLEHIKNMSPYTECIMVTAVNEARVAVDCLKKGAYDYLLKPISREDLLDALKRASERKKLLEPLANDRKGGPARLDNKEAFRAIVTGSEKMFRILREAELHAKSNVPVLITGESGTGKELLAKAIHRSSTRTSFPFTSINMASLTGTLFEAEFFGHTKGAFTGAEKDRTGYLEFTHRGTLFMDEIGDLPMDFQGKLLRVLQDGEFIKLGTSQPRKVDIRFIAATNADIDRLTAKGSFRKDLYYRLKVARLHLPALRERKEDIILLLKQFLREFGGLDGELSIQEDAVSALMAYDYPGNVRELRSILQSAANLSQGKAISVKHLPEYLRGKKKALPDVPGSPDGKVIPLAETEKAHIIKTYTETGNNKVRTAKLLGIGLNTLRRKLASYGIE